MTLVIISFASENKRVNNYKVLVNQDSFKGCSSAFPSALVCTFVSASLHEQQAGGCVTCVLLWVCVRGVVHASVLRWQIPSVNHFRSIYSEACVQTTPAQCCQRSATMSATSFAALTPLLQPQLVCVSANVHLFVCEHIYCTLRLYFCLVVFSVYLCWVALSNVSYTERNCGRVAFNDFCFKSGFTTEVIKSL